MKSKSDSLHSRYKSAEVDRIYRRKERDHRKKVAATLLGLGERVKDVSLRLGVTRQCLNLWRVDPEFQRLEDRASKELERFKHNKFKEVNGSDY